MVASDYSPGKISFDDNVQIVGDFTPRRNYPQPKQLWGQEQASNERSETNTAEPAQDQPSAESESQSSPAPEQQKQSTAAAQPEEEPQPAPAPAPEPQYLDVAFNAGIVKSATAEVFSANDGKSPVIEKLSSGTPIRIEKSKSGWTEIRAPGGFTVWVYGKYVSGEGKNAVIKGKGVRARPLPSTEKPSVVVGSFKNGDSVELLKVEGKWKQVRAPEHLTAWVKSKNITKLKKPTQDWMDRWVALGGSS